MMGALEITSSRSIGRRFGIVRQLLTALVGFTMALGLSSAWAQKAYPNRPVRLVVAYAPGGSTDIVGRMLAQEMFQDLGESVIVDNKAGGGTLVGTDYVRRATPDGYTLLFGTNAFVITPMLHDKPTYDPVKDFQPITLTTVQSLGVLVSPKLKIKTIKELIDYAKANPGQVNFASSGNGSAQHLAGEQFRTAAGIDMVHVAYKGAGPAMNDLMAGVVDLMFTSLVGVMESVNDGRLTLIATTGPKRSPATPSVPTVAESGLPNFDVQSWQAVLAPANMPKPIVDRLHASIVKSTKAKNFVDTLAAQGMEVRTSTPEELRTMMSNNAVMYKKLLEQTKTTRQ